MASGSERHAELPRVVGTGGALLLGLGSVLGTGVFVSLGLATGIAGSSVVFAIVVAALIALFNGLSSAALAARYPVSGGTYEYAHRVLDARLGFVAGSTFLVAKSASAATAAHGLAGYLVTLIGVGATGQRFIAFGFIALTTLIAASGLERSNRANAVMVGITLLALLAFIFGGVPALVSADNRMGSLAPPNLRSFLHATALIFVAYTGYGRVATLGEEVRDPRRTIPRAVLLTVAIAMILYALVASVAIANVGVDEFVAATHTRAAPLSMVASHFTIGGLGFVVALGALTAMFGVLLNLILGLSRVVLAMARRGDLPKALSEVTAGSPRRAVLAIGAVVATIALFFGIETSWSLSAFTVLVYYAITNLSALRLPTDGAPRPIVTATLGLVGCAALAPFVELRVLGIGVAVVGGALLVRSTFVKHRITRR